MEGEGFVDVGGCESAAGEVGVDAVAGFGVGDVRGGVAATEDFEDVGGFVAVGLFYGLVDGVAVEPFLGEFAFDE